MPKLAEDPWSRFQRHYRVDPETGCCLWTRATFWDGYGIYHVFSKTGWRQVRAHRFAWEHAHGVAVPEGLVVAHLCNQRACVNPEHLVAQTTRENNVYAWEHVGHKGRAKARAKLPSLHRPPPREIGALSESDRRRFEAAVGPTIDGGCKLWQRFVEPTGYGRFSIKHINYPAHRVALAISGGRVLRSCEVVLHACRNRHCVAPEHLRVGTQKENIREAIEIGLHNSVRRSDAKLDQFAADEIRRLSGDGASGGVLARKFGVSRTTIYKVLKDEIWVSRPIAVVAPIVGHGPRWPAASGKTDYGTPLDFFKGLDARFGFTVDVCAHAGNAKCSVYFSPEQNGLAQEWSGVCWMNPPYGRGIDLWMKKARASAATGATVVCLVPAYTHAKWWHEYVLSAFAGVRVQIEYPQGRLQFDGMLYPAPFSSAVVVYSPDSVDK